MLLTSSNTMLSTNLVSITPRSQGHRDVTATYIRGWKYPHIYTLSISASKNQSIRVCGVLCSVLYIPTYEYNYRVITRYDTILQEYYITDRCKCENMKRYTIMNSTKDRSRFIKGKLESKQKGLEVKGSRRSAHDPRFHCASLISNRENLQAPSSGI